MSRAVGSPFLRRAARPRSAGSALCLLTALSLSLSGARGAAAENGVRWPYPLAETERVIGLWLADEGFDVSRSEDEMGRLRLSASRGPEKRTLLLSPCSALAACVSALSASGSPDPDTEKALALLRDRYAAGAALDRPLADDEVPAAVAARKTSAVCLEVPTDASVLRSSGFWIEGGGRVVTTAHDLEGVRRLTVLRGDGSRSEGTLARLDREADLALIQVSAPRGTAVSLKGARGLLADGEAVFSIGCPTGPAGTVRLGRVRTPLRRVGRQPLWQVEMETLAGSSGSPVFDAAGNLAGVVKGRLRGTEKTGFVIPLDTLLRFLGKK